MFPASTYDYSQHLTISRQRADSNPVKVPVPRFLREFPESSAAFHLRICCAILHKFPDDPFSSMPAGILGQKSHTRHSLT